MLSHQEVFIVGVAIAVVVLVSRVAGRRIGVPDAVLLVVLGLAVSFVPGLPTVRLDPQVVFLGFLPPLVYHAGFFTAPRETKSEALPIAVLAVVLVLATTASVAAAAHLVLPGLGWAGAFTLGAVVAPTDPVAATSVLKRLGAPTRITTIIEGESLVNDGVALTIFGLAIAAVSGHFSVGHGVVAFIEVAAGGVAYGVAVGWVISRLRRYVRDANARIVVSLVTPYLAYIPADQLGLSGVLATVAAGFFLGTRGSGLFQAASRLVSNTFWEVLVFLLEALLFVLLGLQFRAIVAGIDRIPVGKVVAVAAVVTAVVIAVRLAWQAVVPPVEGLVPGLDRGMATMPWRQRMVIGWSGIRGAISFAAALSIPVQVAGRPFPDRNLVLFVTIVVVLVTLVGQATTLPLLLRALGVAEGPGRRGETVRARLTAARAALHRLGELEAGDEIDESGARVLRQLYEMRVDQLAELEEDGTGEGAEDAEEHEERRTAPVRLDLVGTERRTLRQLYDKGEIGIHTLRDLVRELDLEEARLRRQAGDRGH
ncbi:MAG: Na+/H+ antiporter [Acidimicrobiales bacterium]